MTSITSSPNKQNKAGGKQRLKQSIKKWSRRAAVAAFWLLAWYLWYKVEGREILVPSPFHTAERLVQLMGQASFWAITATSLLRIMAGFFIGVLLGTALAVVTSCSKVANALLSPLAGIAKATPVASFIILALVLLKRGNVPPFIAALMVFPILWSNVSAGIANTDKKLLEKAAVYRIPFARVVRHVYFPQVFPFFLSGATTAMGMAWKAGVAAEVLSTPKGTIGTQLYNAKVYLETVDLFAWTIVVIVLSMVLEWLFVKLLSKIVVKDRVRRRAQTCLPAPQIPAPLVFTVTKAYGDKRVLEQLPVRFAPGVTAVTGVSGRGKTTLLRVLCGLEKPEEKLPVLPVCAYLFQEDRLLPQLNAQDNIYFVNPAADAAQLLAQMQLGSCAQMLPGAMSGGMQRRLAIAVLLAQAQKTGFVLLDEPFRGLDEQTKEKVAEYVFAALQGKIVVFVTHDAAEAQRYADFRLTLT